MAEFTDKYVGLLNSYLANGEEEALNNAYELGRTALSEDVGLLDITTTHFQGLDSVLEQYADQPQRLAQCHKKASLFLDEVLSPFEVSRLSSRDANTALRKLYEVLESESKRLAHILHDESAQMLATVYLELAEISRESPQPLAERVDKVVSHLDEVRDQLRRLSHELRPLILDQLGLEPALKFLADGIRKRAGFDIKIRSEVEGRFAPSVETVIYRCVQEALNNVSRHAKASRVDIHVWQDHGQIHCCVDDDGVGFEVPGERLRTFSGLGLIGIKERVASLDGTIILESTPGEGTSLQLAIPI